MHQVKCKWLWGAVVATLTFGAAPAAAQVVATGTIRGSIQDSRTTRALLGARVEIVGSRLSASVDAAGNYELRNVPTGQVHVLAVSIGFAPLIQTVTLAANETVVVNFRLTAALLELDAIVSTATGQQSRREVGNVIATISATDQIELAAITTFTDLIAGNAAGVDVLGSGGTTGTGSRIRIRGSNSVSLANDPVIYIDGIRVSNDPNSISFETGGQSPSRFNDLEPEDIESIEIIKGPSATTLYGTEAANGVIWITTKKGQPGQTRWSVFAEAGSVIEPNEYPFNYRGFDAGGGFCFLADEAAGTCTQTSLLSFNPLENSATTPFRNGSRQKYGASVSGGEPNFSYFLSGQFEKENGVMEVNSLEAVNLRGNFTVTPSEKLNFNISTGYVTSDLNLSLNDNFALGVITNGMGGFWDSSLGANGYSEFSPDELFNIETTQNIDRFTTSVAGNWAPLSFLTARATFGLDLTNRVDDQFFPTGEAPAFLNFDDGARFVNRFQVFTYTADFGTSAVFPLTESIGSRTSVGGQYIQLLSRGTLATGRQLVAGSRSIAAAAITESSEETVESITLGAYIEQTFDLENRLFLTAAVRADDNSAFGRDFNLVKYPKVSASWVMSEEDFFPESSWLNSLRVRGAWGESGLQPGTNDALRFFLPVSATADGADVTGVTFGGLGNPALKPERSREFEFGVDAELLGGRAGVELTYYDKRTRDALVFRQLPLSLGVGSGRFENLGSVKNSGVEATIRALPIDNESISWELLINASTNSNELLNLGAGVEPVIFRFQRHVPGFPLGGYWDLPIESFNDADGNGIIDVSEVVVGSEAEFLGSAFPTRNLSLRNVVRIGERVQISGLLDYRGGQKLLNFSEAWRLGQNNTRAQNDITASLADQARAVASEFLGTDAGYVEDASFWKLRELSVTVFAPSSWTESLGVDRLSLLISGRNLFTITDYSGIDPELNETGQSNFFSREFMTQGPVRYWTARLNIGF